MSSADDLKLYQWPRFNAVIHNPQSPIGSIVLKRSKIDCPFPRKSREGRLLNVDSAGCPLPMRGLSLSYQIMQSLTSPRARCISRHLSVHSSSRTEVSVEWVFPFKKPKLLHMTRTTGPKEKSSRDLSTPPLQSRATHGSMVARANNELIWHVHPHH